MNERVRKFISGIIVGAIIFGSISFYAELTRASAPAINYISPSNGATFVDIYNGAVNYTVNVTDADGDLQKVELWSNCTSDGTWAKFYDSGALGGVNYHNASGYNTNWSISGKLIYWRICTYDGAWTNYTYSFRNEWAFNKYPIAVVGGGGNYYGPCIAKDRDNPSYLLTYYDVTNNRIMYKYSTNGTDWMSIEGQDTGLNEYIRPDKEQTVYRGSDIYFYNNSFFTIYASSSENDKKYRLGIGEYNLSSWNYHLYNIYPCYYSGITSYVTSSGFSMEYYSGKWILLSPVYSDSSGGSQDLNGYSLDNPESTSYTFLYAIDNDIGDNDVVKSYTTSEVYNGLLYFAYVDEQSSCITWGTFDGNTWSIKGTLASGYDSLGLTLVHDKLNDVLVAIYCNATNQLVYRVTTDGNTWSDEHVIPLPSGWEAIDCYASYFDQRINLVFAGKPSGSSTYAIYMLTYPYLEPEEGIDFVTGRIRFPDATPNQHNVNSTVFKIRNVGNRTIDWIKINWSSFGDIQTANNIRVWGSLDNSSWTVIGTLDASGNLTINATTWASGMPLNPREYRYMKFEILNVGSVAETTHVADYSIRWIIHFA